MDLSFLDCAFSNSHLEKKNFTSQFRFWMLFLASDWDGSRKCVGAISSDWIRCILCCFNFFLLCSPLCSGMKRAWLSSTNTLAFEKRTLVKSDFRFSANTKQMARVLLLTRNAFQRQSSFEWLFFRSFAPSLAHTYAPSLAHTLAWPLVCLSDRFVWTRVNLFHSPSRSLVLFFTLSLSLTRALVRKICLFFHSRVPLVCQRIKFNRKTINCIEYTTWYKQNPF